MKLTQHAPFWLNTCAIAALVLSGCTPPAPIIKTVEVPVTKYVQAQIPLELLAPCTYAEPDKGCMSGTQHFFCNGQLVQMLVEYRAALATCNTQLQAIGKLQPTGN